jgi:hypothetical protein
LGTARSCEPTGLATIGGVTVAVWTCALLTLGLALALARPAQAGDPPRPLPHPSAKGKKVTWVAYTWERRFANGWLLRCYVPAEGKRRCELIGGVSG